LIRVLLTAVLFLAAAAPAGRAADDSLPTEISPTRAHVGDIVKLRITVVYPEGASLEIPSTSFKMGDLEVLGVDQGAPERQEDGRYKRVVTYDLAAYRTGSFPIPSVEIRQTAPEAKSFKSAPGQVEIVTVLTGKETDIEDIKRPMTIPYEWPWLWIIVGGLALLAAAALWYWLRRRARRRVAGPSGGPEPVLLSPEEEAALALRRLEESGLLRRNDLKEYCIRLTEILKHYVYRRHGVPVEERTTTEILRDSSQRLPEEVLNLLEDFLVRGDLVKFAKYQATLDEIREMFKWAARMIDVSRPRTEGSPAVARGD